MTINVNIETALLKAVETMSAHADFTGIQFQMPNRVLDPTPDRYVMVTVFRNDQQNYAWSTGTVYPGILQLMVVDRIDRGSIPALEIADKIVSRFPKGRILTEGVATVKIEVEPEVLTPVQDGHKTQVPVSVRYRCFA